MTLTLRDLLGKGYFPKELPPPFTTDSYAACLTNPMTPPPPGFGTAQPHSPCCDHSLLRIGRLRRHLKIPNPAHFYLLAGHVVTNWVALEAAARRSPYSLSLPTTGGDRAITPEHDLRDRPLHRAQLRAGGRYLVQADIQRFFPSVYTHSLPWALLGKVAAKQLHASKQLQNRWEDVLDRTVRNTMAQQTIGIPVGPDTSRLLAEVVLSAIDHRVAHRVPAARGIRFIDDYEFVVHTRAEAEAVLDCLQQELAEYELELNPAKTAILELPHALDAMWTSSLRTHVFRGGGSVAQKSDLIAYFGLAFDHLKRHPEEGVIKYAVSRMGSLCIDPSNWDLYEQVLQQCVAVDPACLPQVWAELSRSQQDGHRPRKAEWATILNRIIVERLPLGHASEAAWAMWLLWHLGAKLLQKSAKAVGNTEDSVAGLMGLALTQVGLANATHLAGLSRFVHPQCLYGPQWLLCYEAGVRGWFPALASSTLNDPAFGYLASNQVRFLDVQTQTTPPAPQVAGGGGGGGAGY